MFPNPPGLLRLEPYSDGLRDRIWWGGRLERHGDLGSKTRDEAVETAVNARLRTARSYRI